VLVQPNGSILVGGVARQGQNKAAPYLGALVRFTCSGILDSTFGSGGQVLSTSARWAWMRRVTSSSSRRTPT